MRGLLVRPTMTSLPIPHDSHSSLVGRVAVLVKPVFISSAALYPGSSLHAQFSHISPIYSYGMDDTRERVCVEAMARFSSSSSQ